MIPKVVFMGSPEFAVPVMRKLSERYPVVGVVTQPDRPSGRGRILTPPPIKLLADELGLPVIQPDKLREPDTMQQLVDWSPDLIVVAAFGQILRHEVLDLPRFGCVNVHASLLPRWRGAAPIQAAILNGDEQTGISIMVMDPGVDTGPILDQLPLQIDPTDTAGSLTSKLSKLGAELMLRTLPAYVEGNRQPQPQDESQATYTKMIKKEDGLLDFSQPATHLERKVRAYNPWPGAFTHWKGQLLKIHRAHISNSPSDHPGIHAITEGLPAVTTGDGILVFDELQPAGKQILGGKAFLSGAKNWVS